MVASSQSEESRRLGALRACVAVVLAAPALAAAQLASINVPVAGAIEPGPEPSDSEIVICGPAPVTPEPSASRSVGVPDRGRLRDAVLLRRSAHVATREVPEGGRVASYGTAELVGLIERAAAAVAERHPGARLSVGDLSAERGGRLSPHRSHRSGRDADVGFYLRDEEGRSVVLPRFVNIGRRGTGRMHGQVYRFDVARNWDLLVALTSDAVARVQYVLITPYLRRLLLDEGRRRGAPAEVMERVELVTHPHSGSASHRSHFHVRIYCPVDDRPECRDEPPLHPWYDAPGAPAVTNEQHEPPPR